MSGDLDEKEVRKPPRKQWKTYDGPRSSLHRLRSQVAETGDLASQVALAKQLIGEVEELRRLFDGDDPVASSPPQELQSSQETAELGVYWLLKAAEQGHAEATDLLKRCLDAGLGITQHNYVDVTKCLERPLLERVANRAAIELFKNVSKGEEYVTTNQLKVRIKSVQARKKMAPPLKRSMSLDTNPDASSLEEEFGGEKLSEENLRSAARSYARGELPVFQNALATKDAKFSVTKAYAAVVEEFSSRANRAVVNLLPLDQLRTVLILVVFATMRWDVIAHLIPIFVFYVSLVFAVGANCQMLQASADFKRFKIWSRLFRDACPELETQEPELRFVANRAKDAAPRFFASLLISVAVKPLVDPAWMPGSELVILGVVFCIWSFATLCKATDGLVLGATGLHLLSIYLAGEGLYQRGPGIFAFFGKYFYRWRITSEVYVNLQLPHGLIITSLAVIYVAMCKRNNGAGFYTTLVPHLVSISWCRFAAASLTDATYVGLIRSTMTLIGLVFLIPVSWLNVNLFFVSVAAALGCLPFLALSKFIMVEELLLESTLVIGLCLMLAVMHWVQRDGSLSFSKSRAILKGFVVVLACLMAFQCAKGLALRFWGEDVWKTGDKVSISWERYSRICVDPVKDGLMTEARTQKECTLLEGCQ
ncbi:unnamed protein product [Notodromas monacha]|uniref:Wolframin EF-hand domain-containing protein n=1 Tax=Notodromas monacha TaxID=399045 RepID=A0A7R9BWX7_9CRUS|nr:unnamed protein product [Notodromas monacha]CAG0923310.1 unnamed protein product [Notodromas monacha]